MGYDTHFEGKFQVTPTLRPEHAAYLRQFAETRRMERDASLTTKRPDPIREAVGLPVGPEGAFFVGETGSAGQDHGPDVTDSNGPPASQPGLWCQWIPNEDGTAIEWDEGEKFYKFIAWIEYLIENFLKAWGYALDGTVEWTGEDNGDMGKIVIEKNELKVLRAKISFE
jgi:hypothetical protein